MADPADYLYDLEKVTRRADALTAACHGLMAVRQTGTWIEGIEQLSGDISADIQRLLDVGLASADAHQIRQG